MAVEVSWGENMEGFGCGLGSLGFIGLSVETIRSFGEKRLIGNKCAV